MSLCLLNQIEFQIISIMHYFYLTEVLCCFRDKVTCRRNLDSGFWQKSQKENIKLSDCQIELEI